MRSKFILLFLSLMVIGGQAYSAVTSYDYTFTANDIHSANFHTKLNRNFSQSLTGGINSVNAANVVNDSLGEAEMADEINPRIRTYEGAACEFVYTGLVPATDSDLTTDISAGTAYPRGYRIVKNSATSHTFTASKWTYVDLDQNGDFQYSEVAIGGAAPSVASNSIRLARVSSDASAIVAVQDLRTTSCTNGPFSIIRDSSGEATLGDILSLGASGWENGLSIATRDTSSILINAGTAYINGNYGRVASQLTVDSAIVASASTNQSGIDSGSLAAYTNYYVYAVADAEGEDDLVGVISTSPTAPSGTTNYRRIGEVSTDSAATFYTTTDASAVFYNSISYLGKIRQIKAYQTGAVATGSTIMPNDNTIPQITEGDEFMALYITPTSASNKILVYTVANLTFANVANGNTAIFRGTSPDAIATCGTALFNNTTFSEITCMAVDQARTTSQIRYSLRAGTTSGTNTFNGTGGSRLFGGSAASSIILVEFEP